MVASEVELVLFDDVGNGRAGRRVKNICLLKLRTRQVLHNVLGTGVYSRWGNNITGEGIARNWIEYHDRRAQRTSGSGVEAGGQKRREISLPEGIGRKECGLHALACLTPPFVVESPECAIAAVVTRQHYRTADN